MKDRIHLSEAAILGLPRCMTAWRTAACGVRVDKWFTQEGEGEGDLRSVTCGNCLRTRSYRIATDSPLGDYVKGRAAENA